MLAMFHANIGNTPAPCGIFSWSVFFPSTLAFCKKAVERVNSEKNILNRLVEWSGVENLDKSYIYICTSSDPAR